MKYLVILFVLFCGSVYADSCEMRGDLNGDGKWDIVDLIWMYHRIYGFGPPFGCSDHVDVNGDGQIDGSDFVYFATFINGLGPAPVEPLKDLCCK